MLTSKRIPFTQAGYDALKQKFDQLTKLRKEVVVRLSTAREMGDLSENGAYKAAKFELAGIDRQLRQHAYLIQMGVITKKSVNGVIGFSSIVTLDDGKTKITYLMVSKYESDPKVGKLSVESPLGIELLGKSVGDQIKFVAPVGEKNYLVEKVE